MRRAFKLQMCAMRHGYGVWCPECNSWLGLGRYEMWPTRARARRVADFFNGDHHYGHDVTPRARTVAGR